jgi:LacI family transcriptional regulator
MAKRATIADLAKASGVSIATVNRVLRGSTAVRADTANHVHAAAQDIGFGASGLIKSRLRERLPRYQVGVLLQRPSDPFYADFMRRLHAAVTTTQLFQGSASFDYWKSHDGDEIADRLAKLAKKSQAVALVSPDHPAVSAVIEEIKSKSIPVFSLLSDCAPATRTSYVGVDNRKAGRTAGWAIAQCARAPGEVAVFVGSHRFHGHELREIGLRSYFREYAPEFSVLETRVNSESSEMTYEMLSQLIERHKDLVGCYVAGGGTAGAIAAVRRCATNRRPVVVCNDSPTVARGALTDRMLSLAISEPLDRICHEVVEATALALRKPGTSIPGQIFVPFELFTPENI